MVSAHLREVTIERTPLARGCGWQVSDATFRTTAAVARFESRHDGVAIAAVTAGSFRYRSSHGCVTLMPGALTLGNAGAEFECSYDGTWGDRCISFGYTCDYFERIAAGAGNANRAGFNTHRIAPTPAAIALTAEIGPHGCGALGRACAARRGGSAVVRRWRGDPAERARRAAHHQRARPHRGALQRAVVGRHHRRRGVHEPVSFPARVSRGRGRHAAPVSRPHPPAPRRRGTCGARRADCRDRVRARVRRPVDVRDDLRAGVRQIAARVSAGDARRTGLRG